LQLANIVDDVNIANNFLPVVEADPATEPEKYGNERHEILDIFTNDIEDHPLYIRIWKQAS
jgi:hypothetical protein